MGRKRKHLRRAIIAVLAVLILYVAFGKSIRMSYIKAYVRLNQSKLEEYAADFINRSGDVDEEYWSGTNYSGHKWAEHRSHDKYGSWGVSAYSDQEDHHIVLFDLYAFGLAPSGWTRKMYYSPDNLTDFDSDPSGEISEILEICDHWYWYEVRW